MLSYKIKEIIKEALLEDMNNGDITTDNLVDENSRTKAEIKVKEDGVIAGVDIAKEVFKYLDKNISFEKKRADGDKVTKDTVIATLEGSTRAILSAERTALNILQRLSGIATKTSIFVEKVNGYNCRVVDTRKTTPGLRMLEKYAVRVGGGHNHRFNLSDSVMIKDNHIKAAGGIEEAVNIIKAKIPHTIKVEVEVEDLNQLNEALKSGADIIMLDNMECEDMKKAVSINKGRAILEASGNIELDTIERVAQTGVDIISSGGLTHSVKALDISLNIVY
ncbi:carboxylating nicotinate-nucleotide diphosphorylase [Clostridium sp. D2Q-11]|uniref:Probable nicotinate-nucleotide pyrophosphorylase [carboxylating] n=1 Tax=Anaeromonas frigoriresistens TaxID=2683708 RepID=A0A942Z6I6_9FIRM|nr:carboxylating nicotinate-nucleotide diphosphorylase [Anaeromonas frigoriresistens]MBS4537622.1 carboxylating nicotinate-nucleotide diphosphorylase [Anaeromonas frigoriresistens]